MILIVTVLIIGLIPAMIASSKGRGFVGWYIYGCLLFIVALVHALLLKSPAQQAQEAMFLRRGHSEAEELEKFAKLKDQGVITEAEFQAKKRVILGTGSSAYDQF
jgi:hypothetical protein